MVRRILTTPMIMTVLLISLSAVEGRGEELQPDLRTPRHATETLVRAAETLDAQLWAQCLSSTDRALFDATNSPSTRDTLQKRKAELDARLGRALGDDLFEYASLLTVADVTGYKGLPPAGVAMAHVLAENVWDDRYAEVTLLLPLEVRGYLPPMTFYFLKEEGGWKLAQWLTSRLMLGWGLEKTGNPDATITILLKAYANMDLDRGNCTNLVRREYPLSAAAAAAYRKAVAEASPSSLNQLLLLWAIAGDEEADRRIAGEDAKDPKAGLANQKRLYAKVAVAAKPCAPSPAGAPDGKLTADSPELWYRTLSTDAVGLRALLKRFPEERSWCAKATLGIADADLRREAFEEAAAGYEGLLKDYPEATDEVVQAKGKLASLYWSKLNRKREAIRLWRELEAVGKLPPDAHLGEHPMDVETLLVDPAAGWLAGVMDFDVTADGGLVVLRLGKQPGKEAGKGTTLSTLELYDAAGMPLKTLLREEASQAGSQEIFLNLQRFGARYAVTVNDASGKFLVFDASGSLTVELTRRGNGFEATPAKGPPTHENSFFDVSPRASFMEEEWFAVLTPQQVRRFDYGGRLLAEFAIPREEAIDNYKPCLAGNRDGVLVFSQPKAARVFKVDGAGTVTPMKVPGPTEGGFTQISHLFTDRDRNVYLVDPPSRRVLEFDPSGTFLRSFGHESVTEPTNATVDEQGNVYVVGYGFNGGQTVTVIDGAGRFLRAIRIATDEAHQPNGNILDVEVSGEEIFVVVGKAVLRCDRDGRILSIFKPAGGESSLTLMKDGSGQIFFRDGGKVFRFAGDASQELAVPLDEAATRAQAAGLPGMLLLGLDRGGAVVGLAPTTNELVRADPATGAFRRIKRPPRAVIFGGVAAVDADGRILAADGYGREITAIAPDGAETAFVRAAKDTRKAWHPQDVLLDKEGSVYVHDGANHSLVKFKADGSFAAEADLGSQVPRWVRRVRLDPLGRVLMLVETGNARSIVRVSLASLYEGVRP